MIFIVVVFPAPLGPRKPKISPNPTEKDTSESTVAGACHGQVGR